MIQRSIVLGLVLGGFCITLTVFAKDQINQPLSWRLVPSLGVPIGPEVFSPLRKPSTVGFESAKESGVSSQNEWTVPLPKGWQPVSLKLDRLQKRRPVQGEIDYYFNSF